MRSVAHYRKWIAPLLAAAMILCGICLDLGQADAVFSRAVQPAEKTTEAYLARTLVSQQESPCTTEQLGLKSAQALTESRRSSEQNLKVVLGLFLLLLFTVLQTRIRTEKRKNPERALVRRRCIIRYIHRQATGGKYIWLRILWQWFCFSSCYARASGAGGWKMEKSDKKETCVFSRMGVY